MVEEPSHFLLWTQPSILKESFPNFLHAPLWFFTEQLKSNLPQHLLGQAWD